MSVIKASGPADDVLTAMNVSQVSLAVDRCTPRDRYARTDLPPTSSVPFPCVDPTGQTSQLEDFAIETLTSPWERGTGSGARRRFRSSGEWISGRKASSITLPRFGSDGESESSVPENQSERFGVAKFLPLRLNSLDHQPRLVLSPPDSPQPSECSSSTGTSDESGVPALQPLSQRISKGPGYYDRTVMDGCDPYHDWDENLSLKVHCRYHKLPRLSIKLLRTSPKSSTSPPSPIDRNTILASLESHILCLNRNDSVHFFPIPVQRRGECIEQLRKTSTNISSTISGASASTLKRVSSVCCTVGRRTISRVRSTAGRSGFQ
ncbi:hypothetical protein BV22DRAFT_731385 [Leucogyrophana mollusca]|uniref:Uncharacterized protein n=1 Tax=Leucogyrophana mollusca TaxID=85980 RepID=A0ACB8B6W2_9AGAM|nr:hypothetical protein BV22DRAFT_731385 [Leucogyrophana mollusca]